MGKFAVATVETPSALAASAAVEGLRRTSLPRAGLPDRGTPLRPRQERHHTARGALVVVSVTSDGESDRALVRTVSAGGLEADVHSACGGRVVES